MDVTAKVDELAREVRGLCRKLGETGWEIGDRLLQAKALIPHGQFERWLRDHCDGFSSKTATRFMRLRKVYPSPDEIPFGQSAAIVLAQKWVPEEAREEARQVVASGERLTVEKAKAIADRYAPGDGDWDSPETVIEETPRRRVTIAPHVAISQRRRVRSARVPEKRGYYFATHVVKGVRLIVLLSRDGNAHLRAYVHKSRRSYDPTEFGDYSERIRDPNKPVAVPQAR